MKEGKPVVKPGRQVFPSRVPPDSLLLHLTARDLGCLKSGPPAVRERGRTVGGWTDFASENAIVLEKAEWMKLTPPVNEKSWAVDQAVISKILVYFYPQLEANVLSNHRVNEAPLKASIVSSGRDNVRVRLEGMLRMKRVQDPDATFVEAPLAGYVDYDPVNRRIRTFRLMTEGGKCGSRSFGVAVRSVGTEELAGKPKE